MKTAAIFLILSLLLSCNGQKSSVKNAISNTEINDSIVHIMVNDIQVLAFDMLTLKTYKDENFVFSPLGTYYNLLPIYLGAKEESSKELEKIFSYSKANENYKGIKAKLFKKFHSSNYEFQTFNALLLDNNYSFQEQYLSLIKQEMNYNLESVDFTNKKNVAKKVNNTIAENTQNMISNVLKEEDLLNARMILTNTIYFKAIWDEMFNSRLTSKDLFNISVEKSVDVDFMNKTSSLNYYGNDFFEVVELPFQDNEASFFAILPREGIVFNNAVKAFSEDYKDFAARLKNEKLKLSIPQLAIHYTSSLKSSFQEFGVKEIFSDYADLSGISGNKELFVGDIIQAVSFKMHEEGSEASAANVTIVKEKSASMIKNLKFNRPFFYFIRNNSTGVILFTGQVYNPVKN